MTQKVSVTIFKKIIQLVTLSLVDHTIDNKCEGPKLMIVDSSCLYLMENVKAFGSNMATVLTIIFHFIGNIKGNNAGLSLCM